MRVLFNKVHIFKKGKKKKKNEFDRAYMHMFWMVMGLGLFESETNYINLVSIFVCGCGDWICEIGRHLIIG